MKLPRREVGDELDSLVSSLNNMLKKLSRSYGNLADQNLVLEKAVEIRTLELNQALKNSNLENDAKNLFIASMSHELKTPLNSIIGYSRLLIDGKDNRKKSTELRKILNSGQSLLEFVDGILLYSDFGNSETSEDANKLISIDLFF